MIFEFPNIDPIAFSVGPLSVRWYALAYIAGFLLGWRYCLYLVGLNKDVRPNKDDIDDYLAWAILGVILGGRFGYVLFYQSSLYMDNPLEVLKLWHGGMSFHGGVVGVVLSLLIYAGVKKINVFRLADMAACAAPIGVFFGRITNFINGELFGRVTDVPWGIVFPRGGELPRHPSQLYESLLEGLALFTILAILARRESIRARPGVLSGVFLFGYGFFRSVAELFRQPDDQLGFLWGGSSMGQLLSIPMMLAGLFLIAYAWRHEQKT
ncbi:MAG: prolipoprotein diacylglyceryl transferase [Micavibrio sp.]|nr:MAG: prolipoprotein diacylglyceryl transferase [Micavibrio sp.]